MNQVQYHSVDLDQGIRLALASVGWAEAAAFGVWVPAGSRDDPDGRAGLAHFVEHMTFKGTARRSARQLSIEIEGQGGQLNAGTTEDHTCYEARGEADLLPLLVDVVADLVWNPVFPAGELQLEREVIREEIMLYRDSPADHVGDMLAEALWSPHPLGHPIAGSSGSIDRISRDDLVAHAATHHRRRGVVAAVAGPFAIDEMIDRVSPFLPSAHGPDVPPSAPFAAPPGQPARHLREPRDTGQSQLAIGFHTPGRLHPDRHPLRMLSLILGENSSSRLFQELREQRGLCYHVSSDLALFEDTGALEIVLGLEPDQRDLALECIWQQLDDLARQGPTADELERARRYAIGQNRIAFESTSAHLGWIGETLLQHGRIIDPEEARESIRRVTADDVARVAADTFRRNHAALAEIVGR